MDEEGFYLRYPDVFAVPGDGIYQLAPSRASGLGDTSETWRKIFDLATPIVGGVAAWIGNKGKGQEQQQLDAATLAALQAQNNQNKGGLFAGIDTTTLLLIGGAVLLFMSTPGKK